MSHDKVYGVCENKCFVEVEPIKNKIPPLIPSFYRETTLAEYKERSSGAPDSVLLTRRIKQYWEKISVSETKLMYDVGEYFLQSFFVTPSNIHEILEASVMIRHKHTSFSGKTRYIDFETLPLKVVTAQSLTDGQYYISQVSFDHTELNSEDYVYIKIEYVTTVTE